MRESGSGISNSDSDYRSEMVTDPIGCLHVNNRQTRKFCLDGGSNCVIVVSDDFDGHQLVPVEGRTLGTAADGAGLAVEACGRIGIFPNVFHCPNGSNNIVAEWELVELGYTILKKKVEGRPVAILNRLFKTQHHAYEIEIEWRK